MTSWNSSITALEVRDHLLQLEDERALALREGLGANRAYMDDLDAELEHRRALYTVAAVPRSRPCGPSSPAPRSDRRSA
jgi:hypothetical protein